jgi:hypothetical protein
MKTILLTFALAATLSAGLFAIPLTVLVIKESEKIADTIRVFNKECARLGDTATEQQGKECHEKHAAIAEALSKFVILAHEELDFLPEDPAKYRAEQQAQHPELQFDTSPEGDRQTILRRKDMQLQIRWAQHWINCLGREDASECKQERAALDKETYPFGRVGLMTPYPTHVGEEEAKHWHPMKINPSDVGSTELAAQPSNEANKHEATYVQNPKLPPDCVELSPDIKPRDGDYYQSPPEHKPGNVPDSYVLTKVYQHGALLGWCYIDKSDVERLHMAEAQMQDKQKVEATKAKRDK